MSKYSSLNIVYAGVLTGVVTALAVPVAAKNIDSPAQLNDELNDPISSSSIPLSSAIDYPVSTSHSSNVSESSSEDDYQIASLSGDTGSFYGAFSQAPVSTDEEVKSNQPANAVSSVEVHADTLPAKQIGGSIKGGYFYKEAKIDGKSIIIPGFKPYSLCVTDFVPALNPFKDVVVTKVSEAVIHNKDEDPQIAKKHKRAPIVRRKGIPRHALKASEITDLVRTGYKQKDIVLKGDGIRLAMSRSFSQPIEDAVEKEAQNIPKLPLLKMEEEIAKELFASVNITVPAGDISYNSEVAAIEVADPTALDKVGIVERLEEDLEVVDTEAKELANAILPKPETTFETKSVRVKSGDTFENLLIGYGGVSKNNAFKICKKIDHLYKLNRIRKGQKVALKFAVTNTGDEEKRILSSVSLDLSNTEKVVAELNADGIYKAFKEDVALETEAVRSGGKITGSIAASAKRFHIPAGIVAQFVNNFSHNVDFRRDIRSGDNFEVMYEQKVTPDGNIVDGMGELLYASLTLRGKSVSLYRYEDESGFVDYYDGNGHGIKKGIRRRPLGRRRISSPFGMRKHPILRRKRMHWGIDYVAPSGTPIPAAGDGVIEVAKRNGAYGKFIKIRHNNKFKTAYAHMKGYTKGIKSGKRIKQGDVIGYVGNTGRSTGPHLHYEVHKYGKRVNPLRVKIPVAGRKLKGAELQRFVKTRSMINHIFASLINTNKHAKLEKSLAATRSEL
ncbi:MAG: peptidoglycan DD-metalloendopeptidase family protein [Alphaproteobacteria bacterium]|nr:peptidoglycan DD-metalloendopeptidase family protein [Alphaproteobacteria bacterium]